MRYLIINTRYFQIIVAKQAFELEHSIRSLDYLEKFDYGEEWEDAWMKHMQQWQPPESAENYISPQQLNENQSTPIPTHDEDMELLSHIDVWCHFSPKSIKADTHVWQEHDMLADMEYPVHRIIDRHPSQEAYIYTVELNVEMNSPYIVNNVPRRALSFYKKNYQSDIFIEGAFRHEMIIRDELFPSAWKNIVP